MTLPGGRLTIQSVTKVAQWNHVAMREGKGGGGGGGGEGGGGGGEGGGGGGGRGP